MGINLQTFETKTAAAESAVQWFIDTVQETIKTNESCRVVLPTGGSPAAFYEVLTSQHADAVDWSLVEWITLDELIGIPQRHPATFLSQLRTSLFAPLRVPMVNILALRTEKDEASDECARFTALSSDADIVILGIGADGHIGMNFPPAKLSSTTHVLDLPSQGLPSTTLFEEGEEVPTQGITMGVAEILSGKSILLLVDGEKKADALDQLLNGEESENWPVTYLKRHDKVQVFATEDAIK